MGSRFFKSLFFGSSNSNSLKNGSGSYESTVALDPPVKGSYPVAGNGPNVEDILHRARIKREARQNEGRTNTIVSNTTVSRPPSIVQKRSDAAQILAQRPRTAPHNGEAGGGYNATKLGDGRTSSGFSLKSPPSFFPSKRRSSLLSIKSPLVVEPLPPVPIKPAVREIQTYTPKKGPIPTQTPSNDPPELERFVPPFAQKQHQRNFSRNSQSSHVDILDAYSNMVGKEAASSREKASGVRGYGEDVADRNIAVFGDQKLDLTSSDFGYLKSVYSGKKSQGGDEVAHKTSQVATIDGDDTVGPRPNVKSRSSTPLTSGAISPEHAPTSNRPPHIGDFALDLDVKKRTLSPYSSTTSKPETLPPKNRRRQNSDPIDFNALPRGRQVRDSTAPIVLPQRLSSLGNLPPRVVSPVPESPRGPFFQAPPQKQVRPDSGSSSKTRNQKTMGHSSSRPASRNSSVSYSAFPNTTPPPEPTSSFSSQPRNIGKRQTYIMDRSEGAQSSNMAFSPAFTIKSIPGDYTQPDSYTTPRSMPNGNRNYVVEGSKDAPNLDGIVDLTNTVDTEVITNTLPAVTHEQVIPTRHEIRQEKITREIHTHDVFHRVQPIIETEILPTKHYIHAPDGKSLIEIPESQIPGRTQGALGGGYWQYVIPTQPKQEPEPQPKQQYRRSSGSYIPRKPVPSEFNEVDESAESPVVGLARGELPLHNKPRSRGNSRANSVKSLFEPILASKRESVSADGSFKIEYLWRHPPQYENFSRPASSKSVPTYVGAGIGDISPEGVAAASSSSYNRNGNYYFSDEETSSSLSPREGQEMLFRDAGYGHTGGLPGIQAGFGAGVRAGTGMGAYDLNGEFDRMRASHGQKRSKGSGKDVDVLVEREDESDEEGMVEERFRNANRKMRKVRGRGGRGVGVGVGGASGNGSALVVD